MLENRLKSEIKNVLLCWFELYPQITGEPAFPGEAIENPSFSQCPIDPKSVVGLALAAAVPSFCG